MMNTAIDLSMKKYSNPNRLPYDYIDLTLEDVRESPVPEQNEQGILELPDNNEADATNDAEWDTDDVNEDESEEQYPGPIDPNQPFHTHIGTNLPYEIVHDRQHLYIPENDRHNETEEDTDQPYHTDDEPDEEFMPDNTGPPFETENHPNRPYQLDDDLGQPYHQENNSFQYFYREHGPPQDYANEGHPARGYTFHGHPPQGNPYEGPQHGNPGFNSNPFHQPEGNPFPGFTNYDYCVTCTGREITFSYCKINVNDPWLEWGPWGPRPFAFGNRL